jgi:hypothetical protein
MEFLLQLGLLENPRIFADLKTDEDGNIILPE